MPRISAFYGIVITMYYNDHDPPHFHARYGRHRAAVTISSREVLQGSLPARALRLVTEWATAREPELIDDWELARLALPLQPIPPLH